MSLHYLVKKKQVAAERLLRAQTTFSQSVMVSVGVSKLDVTDVIIVDPGAKVNGAYCRSVFLSQQLLPVMRDVSAVFIFQQDSAPAHQTRDTVRLLELATRALFHQICGCQTVPTSVHLTTRYGASSSSECISDGCTTLTNSSGVWCTFGTASTRPSLTCLLYTSPSPRDS